MASGVPYTEKALTDFDIKTEHQTIRVSTDINLSRLVSGLVDIAQSLMFPVNFPGEQVAHRACAMSILGSFHDQNG